MTESYQELRNELIKAIEKSGRGEVERLLGVAPGLLPKVFDSYKSLAANHQPSRAQQKPPRRQLLLPTV